MLTTLTSESVICTPAPKIAFTASLRYNRKPYIDPVMAIALHRGILTERNGLKRGVEVSPATEERSLLPAADVRPGWLIADGPVLGPWSG